MTADACALCGGPDALPRVVEVMLGSGDIVIGHGLTCGLCWIELRVRLTQLLLPGDERPHFRTQVPS